MAYVLMQLIAIYHHQIRISASLLYVFSRCKLCEVSFAPNSQLVAQVLSMRTRGELVLCGGDPLLAAGWPQQLGPPCY